MYIEEVSSHIYDVSITVEASISDYINRLLYFYN